MSLATTLASTNLLSTTSSSSIENQTYQVYDYMSETNETLAIEFPDIPHLLFFTIIWPLITGVGILANMCVIVVMLMSAKLTSATQFFIVNLAISDILFLTICPTLVLFNMHRVIELDNLPALLAKLICKADYFLSHLTVFITCLTLTSMTLDRYMVIMHPLRSLSFRTKTKAISINIVIWILSILFSIPHGYFRVIEEINNSSFCLNSIELDTFEFLGLTLAQFNSLYTIIIAYMIPFVVIIICYMIMIFKLVHEKTDLLSESAQRHELMKKEAKKRRRILTMIALVTVMFGFSWLPIHSLHAALKFFPNSFPFENARLFTFKNVAHTLTYLNSMLNPFFYTMMGDNFRKQVFARHKARYSNRFKLSYYRANHHNHVKKSIAADAAGSRCITLENHELLAQ